MWQPADDDLRRKAFHVGEQQAIRSSYGDFSFIQALIILCKTASSSKRRAEFMRNCKWSVDNAKS